MGLRAWNIREDGELPIASYLHFISLAFTSYFTSYLFLSLPVASYHLFSLRITSYHFHLLTLYAISVTSVWKEQTWNGFKWWRKYLVPYEKWLLPGKLLLPVRQSHVHANATSLSLHLHKAIRFTPWGDYPSFVRQLHRNHFQTDHWVFNARLSGLSAIRHLSLVASLTGITGSKHKDLKTVLRNLESVVGVSGSSVCTMRNY